MPFIQALSSFLAGCSYLPVALYLPTYAASLTPSTFKQSLVLAIFSLMAAVGSAASGYLSDFSYAWTVVACGVCGTVISLTAWGFADSLSKVFTFAVLFSLTRQMLSWVVAAWELVHAWRMKS